MPAATVLALAQPAERVYARFEWAGMPGGLAALGAAALAVALAVGVLMLYRREQAGSAPRARWPACALRLLALAGLGAILLAPSLARDVERDVPGRVVVLLDRSASMSIRDAQLPPDLARNWAEALGLSGPQAVAGLTRRQVARAVLQRRDASLLRALAAANQVDLVTFSQDSTPLLSVPRGAGSVAVPDWQPTGPVTNLAGALRAALDSGPADQPLAGIVVLSDGRDTAGGDLNAVAREARQRGVPVYLVGIGSPAMPRDVAVSGLTAPARAIKGLPVRMQVFVRSEGYEGRQAALTLEATDKATGRAAEVLRRTLTLEADGQRQQVDLTHVPEAAGEFVYEASVEALDGEFRTDNNASSTEIVVSEEKVGVLIVAGGPSYDYRFLKALIERAPTFSVTTFLHGPTASGQGQLPRTREALLAFDVVLLIDPSPGEATDDWLRTLAGLTDSEGLGVIYVAGPTYAPALLNGPAAAPLRDLLPVVPDAARSSALIGSSGYSTESWPVSVDPSAVGHPVLGAPGGTDAAAYWQGLPGLYWAFPVGAAKPGATILLRYGAPDLIERSGRPMALAATEPYGLGNVFYCGSPGTWRWRRAGIERYDRFWLQAVRHSAVGRRHGGTRRAAIMLDRASYAVGEPVRVRARILDARFRPLTADIVQLDIEHDGTPAGVVQARRLAGEEGTYGGVLYPEGFGRFGVTYTAPDGTRAYEPFEVRAPQVEFDDPRLARSAMEQVAATTKGRYLLPGELAELPGDIPDLSRTVIESGPLRPAWDRLLALALLVGALSAEWVLRKRMGLL